MQIFKKNPPRWEKNEILKEVEIFEKLYEQRPIKNNIHGGKTLKKFYYKNRGFLATIGRSDAIVDFWWFDLKGRIGWIFWSIIHIYFLIGFRNRLMVFINWLWSYLTFSKGARLITDDK